MFELTKRKALGQSGVLLSVCLFFGTLLSITISGLGKPMSPFSIFVFSIYLGYALISISFARYPTIFVFVPSEKILLISYLNGFGVKKQDTIKLAGAYIELSNRSFLAEIPDDIYARIIGGYFYTWICVDKSHGFTMEQIQDIFLFSKNIAELKNEINSDWITNRENYEHYSA